LNIGTLHFVGIGGIGMSGIAEVLHNLGYKVQGSDLNDSPTVKRLRELGIAVAIGHAPENVEQAQVVVGQGLLEVGNLADIPQQTHGALVACLGLDVGIHRQRGERLLVLRRPHPDQRRIGRASFEAL